MTINLAEAVDHNPNLPFGSAHATAPPATRKIRGLNESDIIMAAKLHRLAGDAARTRAWHGRVAGD